MSKSRLEELCDLYTDLTEKDIRELEKVASTLQMYANLSDSYMFIDCKVKDSELAVVVAEAFPFSNAPAYENSVLGKMVFESFEPGVFHSYRTSKKSAIKKAVTQEGRSVEQSVVPIANDSNKVIGVIVQEKKVRTLLSFEDSVQDFSSQQESFGHVLDENHDGMPLVSDLLTEAFLMTDHENRLTYANAVGIKFISEMSGKEESKDENIIELLPFLEPIYNQKEDVFVFELALANKNLVVKKVRLREKDNLKGTLLIIQDLTELRTKEKELLMKSIAIQEIHHRVKNNLQTVASLIRMQMRKGIPEESKIYFEDTLNRVFSISAVYELILSNENEDEVDIIKLAEKVSSSMAVSDFYKKINLKIESNSKKILTSSRKAVSIALIINELIQNSVKHAFIENQHGEILVNFYANEDFLELQIFDNGVGMGEFQTSLGLEIVKNLAVHDLNGDFRYLPGIRGTHAVIKFPVSPEVVIYHEEKNLDSRR